MDKNVISIVVLALLILAGGLVGYLKAKSKASLIAGAVSSILLGVCAWLTYNDLASGTRYTFMLIALLEGIFLARLLKTKKFMPSGLLLLLCIFEQIILWDSIRI